MFLKKMLWIYYGGKYKLRKLFLFKSKIYLNKIWLDESEGNARLKELILSEKPFMAARFGYNEISAMKAFDFKRTVKKKKLCMDLLYKFAGFFPNDVLLGDAFLRVMKDSCSQVDLLREQGMPFEDYYINHYMNKDAIITGNIMQPWEFEEPWSAALKGKRVLVIHPFEKSIRRQYRKREFLFGQTEILPEFELKTLRAIQSMGEEKDERFSTWFDALEYMEKEINKIDFDIAIIGCGAYGFPLAAYVKRMGKQAVHMGGASQILFGVKGQRWVSPEWNGGQGKIYSYLNPYWEWPMEEETPKHISRLEGAYFKEGNCVGESIKKLKRKGI